VRLWVRRQLSARTQFRRHSTGEVKPRGRNQSVFSTREQKRIKGKI
jgi:hypothetical protein